MAYSDFFPSTKQMRIDLDNNDTATIAKTVWKGTWLDGTYILNDITRDGEWTMVANKTTTHRPSGFRVIY